MKIMIADDEVIIRTGLAKVIKWRELGLKLLPPAASAEEVLARLPEEKPDILLTDIRMNGMTGLELASEIKKSHPKMEIIILSGYDDFAYAQQAIRNGISDYLLKTSRPEEIIKAVLKVKQRIEERRELHSLDRQKQRQEHQRMLEQWVTQEERATGVENPPDSLLQLAAEHGEEQSLWQVLILAAGGWGETRSDGSLLAFAVDNALRDLLPCVSFIRKERVIAVIRSSESGFALQIQRSVYEKIEQLLKCDIIAVAGKPVVDVEELHVSFTTASEAYEYRRLMNRKQWTYADISERKGGKMVCTAEEEKELSTILLDNDPMVLKSWVHRYVEQLLADPEVTPRSLQAAVQSVVIAAHRWLDRVLTAIGKQRKAGEKPELFDSEPGRLPLDNLFQHLHNVMKLYHNKLAEGGNTHIHKAITYIEEQIGHDLGLQQVAQYVHLHPNHLSDLFKKETGMKFVDYVTQKKMQRAMDILSQSPVKISEVAAMVGYEDVKYFGQMFKKHTGMTPSQYREANS